MRRLLAFFDTPAGRVTRYLVSVALVGALVAGIDWRQFAALRGQVALGPLALAVLLAGVTFPLHAWRWWWLLRAQGLAVSFHWAHVVTWVGNFYNAFLLGGLGGDAARAVYLCRDVPDRAAAGLAATIFDRVLGLVVLLSLAAVTIGLLPPERVGRSHELMLIFAFSLAVCLVAALGGVLVFRQPPAWLAARLGPARTAVLADILLRTRAAPGAVLGALALSYAIWLLDFLSVWLLAHSLGFPLPFLVVSLAMAVAYAATVLPVSVGGHGIREGALVGMLGLLGFLPDAAARNLALLLAVLVWGVSVFWSLAGAGGLLLRRR